LPFHFELSKECSLIFYHCSFAGFMVPYYSFIPSSSDPANTLQGHPILPSIISNEPFQKKKLMPAEVAKR
jgi:hypothetical protein